MRLLICGSRTLTDDTAIRSFLKEAQGPLGITIVHGAAKGADHLAAMAATEMGFEVEAYPADWDRHGKAAGPIRNQQMLDTGIDVVWAFVDKPLTESRGTADMVGRARRAGVPTHVVQIGEPK